MLHRQRNRGLVLRLAESRVIHVDVAVDSRRSGGTSPMTKRNTATCIILGYRCFKDIAGVKTIKRPDRGLVFARAIFRQLKRFRDNGDRRADTLSLADKGFCFLGRFAVWPRGDGVK